MTFDEGKLNDAISAILDRHQRQESISPAWLATETLLSLDPDRISPTLVYRAAHLQLRQLARALCRTQFTGDEQAKTQHSLFPDLQARYPVARTDQSEDPSYVRLESLTKDDWEYNIARLRKEAGSKLRHADALEAWGQQHLSAIA